MPDVPSIRLRELAAQLNLHPRNVRYLTSLAGIQPLGDASGEPLYPSDTVTRLRLLTLLLGRGAGPDVLRSVARAYSEATALAAIATAEAGDEAAVLDFVRAVLRAAKPCRSRAQKRRLMPDEGGRLTPPLIDSGSEKPGLLWHRAGHAPVPLASQQLGQLLETEHSLDWDSECLLGSRDDKGTFHVA